MKKLSVLLVAVALAAASLQAADALAQARQLQSLGFYAGAEDLYRSLERPTREGVKGLLQTLLAQGKAAQAKPLLASEASSVLTVDERLLYSALVSLQTGSMPSGGDLGEAGLDPDERPWAWYVKGLRAFAVADYARAEALWHAIPPEAEARMWTLAILPGPATSSPDLDKRLRKLRRQDFPLAKHFVLGMLARGEAAQARAFLKKNPGRLPKAEATLLLALTFPENTPERAEALIEALPLMDDPALIVVGVGFALKETAINLSDVENQLKTRDAAVALILAQAWLQKGAFAHAYELLSAVKPEELPSAWRPAFYSTQASLAESLSPARYREAANALVKWRDLPSTTLAEAQILQQQIGDAYFKNSDFADAAAAYEKNFSALGFQAVLAWLKAEKPDEAARVLKGSFEHYDDALLSYLLHLRSKNQDVAAALKPFAGKTGDMASRWMLEYLRLDSLAEQKVEDALASLDAALKEIPADASYRTYFTLKKYRLLLRAHRNSDAAALLESILSGKDVPREFLLIAIEQSLLEQKPEGALELLPKIGSLSPADRVNIKFLVAGSLGNSPELLSGLQKSIETLPPAERFDKLLILARRHAAVGQLDKARSIVDALEESSVEGARRDEVDFLRATLLELSGDPSAERLYLTLSQRDAPVLKIRAGAQLAAYYARSSRAADARKIFYDRLASLAGGPLAEEFRGHREELLKCLLDVSSVLPPAEAARLRDWIETQSRPQTNLSPSPVQ